MQDRQSLMQSVTAGERQRLVRYAMYMTRNRDDAEDAVMEALARFGECGYEMVNHEATMPYLRTTIRYEVIDLARRRTRRPCLSLDEIREEGKEPAHRAPGPEKSVCTNELKSEVRQAVRTLPHKQRLLVELYYFDSLGIEEISTRLDLPSGTVKSRLFRARNKLHRKLYGLHNEN